MSETKHISLKNLQAFLKPLMRMINRKAESWEDLKNKPFGSTFAEGTLTDKLKLLANEQFIALGDFYFIEGQKYTVLFDDITYNCTAYKDNYGTVNIGDITLMGESHPKSQDAPFFIFSDIDDGARIVVEDNSVDHSILITGISETITKLPSKYVDIPKGILTEDNYLQITAGMQKGNGEVFNNYDSNDADGYMSHAEGSGTQAGGMYSHAEGLSTSARGDCSHTEGYGTNANGDRSHAEGDNTSATNSAAHAEGSHTLAEGEYSHAEGYDTYASEFAAHAEGFLTKAKNSSAHAEGYCTYANGDTSHAEGYETIADGYIQHVQGKFNIADTTSAHIVGNGTRTTVNNVAKTTKSNAHTLDWQGNAWYAGNVYVGSTSGTNKDDGSKKLATEEYVEKTINSHVANSIILVDQVNGLQYVVSMRDGNLVSSVGTKSITITAMPAKTEYMHGEYFDSTGMVVVAKLQDGTTRQITDYSYSMEYLVHGTTKMEISYTEAGITHTADIPIVVSEFDPSIVLADFSYTLTSDGLYAINGWNGTHNGIASTELIVPNNACILI